MNTCIDHLDVILRVEYIHFNLYERNASFEVEDFYVCMELSFSLNHMTVQLKRQVKYSPSHNAWSL